MIRSVQNVFNLVKELNRVGSGRWLQNANQDKKCIDVRGFNPSFMQIFRRFYVSVRVFIKLTLSYFGGCGADRLPQDRHLQFKHGTIKRARDNKVDKHLYLSFGN